MAQLEESAVTIGTIRGSRYVSPIKVGWCYISLKMFYLFFRKKKQKSKKKHWQTKTFIVCVFLGYNWQFYLPQTLHAEIYLESMKQNRLITSDV